MGHFSWPEISQFHAVRRAVKALPAVLGSEPIVSYRAKVKLHGSNGAVQVLADGSVEAQSRSAVLTLENDNAGFARFVASQASAWRKCLPPGIVLFGEWCGPGIHKGVAVNRLPHKVFVVFAAAVLDSDTLHVEPSVLEPWTAGLEGVYVLPWHGDPIALDVSLPNGALAPVTTALNAAVEAIEDCDPWVKATFGVDGVGEGLVLYPVSHPGYQAFGYLAFKAKGEKHRVVRATQAVTVDPALAQGAADFAALVLPDARLEQGASAVCPSGESVFQDRLIGAFIQWILADVKKETQRELEASGLEWAQVQRPITERARKWYLAKLIES